MNSEEARFVLAAYRPGMDCERDPLMVEVIEQLLRDPNLAQRFACERAFEDAIARKLTENDPPKQLRSLACVGMRAGRRASRRHQRTAFIVSMAAALVVAGGLATSSWMDSGEQERTATSREPLIEWQAACVAIFGKPGFRLDLSGRDYPILERHLLANGTRIVGGLPFDTRAANPIGCKVLSWHGQPVSLVCFRVESGEVLHLFVVPRGVADEKTLEHGPSQTQIGEFATITWTRRDLLILVASTTEAESLASIVSVDRA